MRRTCCDCRESLLLTARYFHRSATRTRKYSLRCKECERRRRRTRTHAIELASDLLDVYPDRCLHRFFASGPCKRPATHRNGDWRACDKHKLPGDRPIPEAAKVVSAWIQ